MTHKLARLLNDAEEKIVEQIDKFEAASGYPSQDVRLLSGNVAVARRKITELGLDPDDTTAEELYRALINRYKDDAHRLESDFGIEGADEAKKNSRAVELAWHCLAERRVWALKSTVTKDALRKLTPARTRKLLGFRSVTSMLKRSDVSLILAAAHHVESASWQKSWQRAVKKLPATAYEMQPLKLLLAPESLKQPDVPVTEVKELGAIIIWPAINTDPSDTLGRVLQILTITQRLTGQAWSRELGQLHPALGWWSTNDHLAAWLNDEPVSFNIRDVAKDANEQSVFEKRSSIYVGQSLWQKLTDSYRQLAERFSADDGALSVRQQAPELAAAEFSDE